MHGDVNEVLPPGPGDVRVWYRVTAAIEDDEIDKLLEGLPALEREQCLRYRFMRDRRDFAAAHALLRATLSRYGNVEPSAWQFDRNPYGKPAIAAVHGTDLTFNLSHTHGLVACAVSRAAAIGIDVESVDRIATGREIATHYFSPAEIGALDREPPDKYRERFIEVWTLKEAYIKAVGLGLSHPLDTFSFVVANDGAIRFTGPTHERDRNWHFHLTRPAPAYRLALAVECPLGDAARCVVTIREADASGSGGT
jgi:4'-phosphopantetheinyl transferase